MPRRVRSDAARVRVRRRLPDDRAGDRAQPGRRRRRPGPEERRGCSRRSPTRTSRPSSASSTSRSTCRPSSSRTGASPTSRTASAPASTTPRRRRRRLGAHMVMIGILPTLSAGHMSPASLSANPRYQLLSDQILAARGEDIVIDIGGPERLRTTGGLDRPGGGLHQHPAAPPGEPRGLPRLLERLAGDRRACSSRSAPTRPFLLGRELWRETRIALFEQATDTRSEELKAQGVRPACLVRRALDHLDLRPLRGERPLLPGAAADPRRRGPARACSRPGRPRRCSELRLHNGTIYRWNRPVYDIVDGTPHLRVENRVLPAGPTVADTMANAAFYYGLVRTLAEQERPLWSQMSFSAAEENFHVAARRGHRGQRVLAGPRPGAGDRAGAASAAADGPGGPGGVGSARRGVRPPARHHRAALHHRAERLLVVRRPLPRPGRRAATPTGSTRCGRR